VSIQTPIVVACVDVRDDGDVAATAITRATNDSARLVFYAVDAASAFSSVRPTRWSADGDQYQDLLTPVQLEMLGEHHVAVAVHRARQAGVDAYGWLPQRRGVAGIGRYARENAADVVVLGSAHGALAATLRDWADDLEVVTA
jgi:nucleotide-binding universal stress UspA family protein